MRSNGCVDDLERRDVLEFTTDRGRRSRARSSSRTRFFATWKSHVVNSAAEREARQPLVDAEEDLLGQVLGERTVAHQPQHVVVDGQLVRADDEREGALITPLGLAEDAEIGLRE